MPLPMAEGASDFPSQAGSHEPTVNPAPLSAPPPDPYKNHERLLKIFEDAKKKCFDTRWIWEREWLRDIYYTIGRQWIHYHPQRREWINKRLRRNTPRPVTNKCAELIQALRASFGSIPIDVSVQPIGNGTDAIAAAEIADQISPILHDEHDMDQILREVDFWLLVTGNAAIQMSWDKDKRFNQHFVPSEQCLVCGFISQPLQIVQANNACPNCQTPNKWKKAIDPHSGQPVGKWAGFGKGKTNALSPFEYALPPDIKRFDETPYIIRMRWREKSYFEGNYPHLVNRLQFQTTSEDRSIQIFRALSVSNDLGGQTNYFSTQGTPQSEGITEYEFWQRPNEEFPEGLVFRVAGDQQPTIIEAPDEGLPGPFPYKDLQGNPVFPFAHSVFEHVGGRFYGRSVLAPVIQKQDQINQIDALIQQIIQRTANPVWIVPEGSGIDEFTGEPGLVLKWNPLGAAGPQAEPKRISGENIPPTLFQLREQYVRDIEEISGTFDILKGARPQGVEAFSAMQLLVERSQARFTSAFSSRGRMYRDWYGVALELERKFGPDQRVQTLVGHNRGYTFREFQKADLQGNVNIRIEDGTNTPKTPLGKRAAIEHAAQLGLINPEDPDQRYTLLNHLGVADLSPSLDVHVQAALHNQDAFENWVAEGGINQVDPAILQANMQLPPMEAPPIQSPLMIKPWNDPMILQAEAIKWLNTDTMRGMMAEMPAVEVVVSRYLADLNLIINPPAPAVLPPDGQPPGGPEGPPPGGAEGAAQAMTSSNSESGSPTIGQGAPASGA